MGPDFWAEMPRVMAELDAALGPAPAARLVTLTIDPGRDTPAALARAAADYGASDNWLWLTGDHTAEMSDAAGTSWLDTGARQWSDALLAASGTVFNARLVMRLGMRRIARGAYAMQIIVSGLFMLALWTDVLPPALRFPAFFLWAVGLFMMAGLTFGNLNALAMQRKGHIAGMTASVVSALSTLGAVMIAAPACSYSAL